MRVTYRCYESHFRIANETKIACSVVRNPLIGMESETCMLRSNEFLVFLMWCRKVFHVDRKVQISNDGTSRFFSLIDNQSKICFQSFSSLFVQTFAAVKRQRKTYFILKPANKYNACYERNSIERILEILN